MIGMVTVKDYARSRLNCGNCGHLIDVHHFEAPGCAFPACDCLRILPSDRFIQPA